MANVATPNDPAWRDQLDGLGLHLERGGFGVRNDMGALKMISGWGVFESKRPVRRKDALLGQLAKPALWKYKSSGGRRAIRRVFELPPAVVNGRGTACGLSNEDRDDFVNLLRWMLDTERGGIPEGWRPPTRDAIEGYLPEGALTLETETIVRQGTLHHGDDRLALGFRILPPLPANLPAVRREWLRELLIDTQNRWRLVRIGSTADEAIEAEVDLTGAPAAAVVPLIRVGLDALRFVVSSIVETAEFLVDPSVPCRTLELRPSRVKSLERGDGS